MPGVFRAHTLSDVLSQLAGQAEGNTDTSVSGVGYFGEASEQAAAADSVTATAQVMPGWDGGTWSGLSWG